ncbi:MAG TPA: MerR family transcriptional regulator [Gallionella sp.]|nr:MerR family transcriptional regulator [Gallionella sp.]
MRIGELAAKTGVSPRVLRHYETQGLIHSQRLPNGYREYAGRTVETVSWIKSLIDCGFSTRQIHSFLPCLENKGGHPGQCAAGLAQHLAKLRELDAMIDVLNARRRTLSERIALFGDSFSTEGKTNGEQ